MRVTEFFSLRFCATSETLLTLLIEVRTLLLRRREPEHTTSSILQTLKQVLARSGIDVHHLDAVGSCCACSRRQQCTRSTSVRAAQTQEVGRCSNKRVLLMFLLAVQYCK